MQDAHDHGYDLDLEFEDVLNNDDEEMPEYNPHLNRAIMKAVDEQIENVDYIKKAYNRLENKHGDFKARNLLATVLCEEIFNNLKNNKLSNDKQYRKKIEALK